MEMYDRVFSYFMLHMQSKSGIEPLNVCSIQFNYANQFEFVYNYKNCLSNKWSSIWRSYDGFFFFAIGFLFGTASMIDTLTLGTYYTTQDE